MLNKFINNIFLLGFGLIISLLFISSVKVIYTNIKFFNIVKTGEIIGVEYVKGSFSDNEKGIYQNKILINKGKDTITGGSQKQFSIGDKVKLRYVGNSGNRIFVVNQKRVRSRYGIWDWVSPIFFFGILLIFYKYIKFKYTKLK